MYYGRKTAPSFRSRDVFIQIYNLIYYHSPGIPTTIKTIGQLYNHHCLPKGSSSSKLGQAFFNGGLPAQGVGPVGSQPRQLKTKSKLCWSGDVLFDELSLNPDPPTNSLGSCKTKTGNIDTVTSDMYIFTNICTCKQMRIYIIIYIYIYILNHLLIESYHFLSPHCKVPSNCHLVEFQPLDFAICFFFGENRRIRSGEPPSPKRTIAPPIWHVDM